jgi:hypothetical protein
VPRRRRVRRERTHDWEEIQQQTLWPEQEVYERLRPLVLFGETAASRAKETGVSERTLRYQADQFEQYGMASLFPKEPASPPDPGRNLPPEMRQLIVDRKRRTSRFPSPRAGPDLLSALWPQALGPHHQTHLGRWPEAFYNRTTIPTLRPDRRWVSAPPHNPARKVTINAINEVGKLARESPELGAFRVRAALEQIGIHLSQATCGRLLSLNRDLYGLASPKETAPRERKEMPFKARFKQEIWSVDVRYIEEHSLGFPEPIYLISVLENYSRARFSSKISRSQNQWDYLEVLFAAFSAFGTPSMIGSSGGAIFYCNQAMDTYSALGIRKERIEPRQAWQNLIETHFNRARKMADAKLARAHTWEEVIAVHQRFVQDYNRQRHWAHEAREDGCHSPLAVLGEHKGTMYPPGVLDRVLFATRAQTPD